MSDENWTKLLIHDDGIEVQLRDGDDGTIIENEFVEDAEIMSRRAGAEGGRTTILEE